MKSAYLVLGVPGNASEEDIEIAFARAKALYPPERLANTEGALEKFNEVKTAYNVLRNKDSREAHDRKLAGGQRPGRPQTVVIVQEASPISKLFTYGLVLVALIFGAGFFVSYKNAEARKEQAALELATKQKAAKDEELQKAEAEKIDLARAQAKAKAESDDRRMAVEGQMAAARAGAERSRQEQSIAQMQRTAVYEAQRQEAAQRSEEQRSQSEARMRVEADKRRIRELCYQQYRRYDC